VPYLVMSFYREMSANTKRKRSDADHAAPVANTGTADSSAAKSKKRKEDKSESADETALVSVSVLRSVSVTVMSGHTVRWRD
jgi:hypothetical protein